VSEAIDAWIRISPEGKRSGFVSVADGEGGTLTITILPKPWASHPVASRSVDHTPGTTTHVVCHELDFLRLRSSAAATRAILYNVTTVAAPGERSLIAASPPPDKGTEPSCQAEVSDPFGDLVGLLGIARRGGSRLLEDMFQGGPAKAFTRVLTQERFLRELQPLLFRARPRYLERVEDLASPTGRLDDSSLLVANATGRPWIRSVFDDLTMDTPLLRVMRAALHVIVSDRIPPGLQPLGRNLDRRASQFAQHFATVTPLHREQALLVGERLWLGHLDRPWEAALDAALEVLRDHGPLPADGTTNTDAFIVHVMTEKFWEQVVAESLEMAFGDVRISADKSPGEGVDAPKPWISVGGAGGTDQTFPDFMFRHDLDVVLADAKYKRRPSIESTDAYQLFTYSHLARLDGKASDTALLVFPASPYASLIQVPWQRFDSPKYLLWLISMAFPSQDEVTAASAWRTYLGSTASGMREAALDWLRPSPSSGIPAGSVASAAHPTA